MAAFRSDRAGVRCFAKWLATTVLLAFVGCGTDPVAGLIGKLQDEDVDVRRAAAQSLLDMGLEAAPAAEALGQAIEDQDREVRRLALHAISQIGPQAAPYLPVMKNALDDGEVSVRIAAAIAINRLDPNDVEHQRVLIAAMKSGDGGIIVRVGQMSSNAVWAVPTLIKLLGDRRPGIRRITADALEKIGSAAIAAKATLIRVATNDPDERVREAAVRALGWMNTNDSPAADETSPTPDVE